jgi:predicted metal-dependent phosphoesterase TrpH
MTTPLRNRVDLHTHTARSDGVLEPLELHRQMAGWGSDLVAITDHDTLAGARELLTAGLGGPRPPSAAPGDGWVAPRGPAILVGVEINTLADGSVAGSLPVPIDGAELHILGFGVDPDDPVLEKRLAAQRSGRRDRLERTLDRLDQLGIPVRASLPRPPGGIDALGRPHVARALVAAGHAESVDEAFARYLEPGAPAYVRRAGMGTRDAIDAILDAGGVPSLAHAPWVLEAPGVVDRLRDWGLQALEVYYRGWDDATIDLMARFAQARGLLPTGGSDYHGDTIDYATAQASVHVPPIVGDSLLEALADPSRVRR